MDIHVAARHFPRPWGSGGKMNQEDKRLLLGTIAEKQESLNAIDIKIDRDRKEVTRYLKEWMPVDEIQPEYALSALNELIEAWNKRKELLADIKRLKEEL